MDNQRTEPRKKLMAFTPVYDLLHKTLLGYVGDLTLKGVMIVGQKPLEINKNYTLGIEFPENLPELKTTHMVISGRTARCQLEDNEQYYDIGFEFVDLSVETAVIIQAVLDRYQFRTVLSASDLKP